MFPFQKIFTLLIRTFSRPMLGYVKRKQIEKPGSKFAGFFIGLGRRSHRFQHWVNHRILKTVKVRQAGDVREEVLLEKGIESFYEILFYVIVLGLPFWELYKASAATQRKEETLQNRIHNLEKKLTNINEKITKIANFAKERSKQDKQRAIKQVQQYEQIIALKEKKKANARMNILGEAITTPVQEDSESAAQKLEELFENAIEVVADEFEDSLDDLQFGQDGGSEAEAALNDIEGDAQIDSIEADGEEGTTDLQDSVVQGDFNGDDVDVENGIEVQTTTE